jgi:hypothetical protein
LGVRCKFTILRGTLDHFRLKSKKVLHHKEVESTFGNWQGKKTKKLSQYLQTSVGSLRFEGGAVNWAAVSEDYILGALNTRHLLPPSPGGWKFEVKVWPGLVPPEASLLGV